MFPNCIDRFGRQKKKERSTRNKQRKTMEKNKQIKNGNNSTYHEPLSEECIGDKFLIPVYKTYLYATLPPSGLYRI